MEVSLQAEEQQTRIWICLPQSHTNTRPYKRDPTARSPDILAAVVARPLRHKLACTECRTRSHALVLSARRQLGSQPLEQRWLPAGFQENRVGWGAREPWLMTAVRIRPGAALCTS